MGRGDRCVARAESVAVILPEASEICGVGISLGRAERAALIGLLFSSALAAFRGPGEGLRVVGRGLARTGKTLAQD